VAEITDEYMFEQLQRTRDYSIVLLHAGPQFGTEGSDAIIFEHGRRNFSLRADGLLSIVCPSETTASCAASASCPARWTRHAGS
jgi:hypothetical protein